MRSVFVNDKCVRIDQCCGFWPLHDCPVQDWTNKNNIDCTKLCKSVFEYEIRLKTDEGHSQSVTQKIQNICDKCKFGEMQHTR